MLWRDRIRTCGEQTSGGAGHQLRIARRGVTRSQHAGSHEAVIQQAVQHGIHHFAFLRRGQFATDGEEHAIGIGVMAD